MEVKVVKLVTGEEVLANVIERDNSVKLNQPMLLLVSPEGLRIIPWLMLGDNSDVEISMDKVIVVYKPKAEIINGYKQQTGGIVTAPATALNNLRT